MAISVDFQFEMMKKSRTFDRAELDDMYMNKGLAYGRIIPQDNFMSVNLNSSLHQDVKNQQLLGIFCRYLIDGDTANAESIYVQLPRPLQLRVLSDNFSNDYIYTVGDLASSRSRIELAARSNNQELKLWALYRVVREGIAGGSAERQ